MKPDERVFVSHLELPDFVRGVKAGRWRYLRRAWPYVWIAVSAAPRPDAPDDYVLRFELTNYPVDLPTATPWDETIDAQLAAEKRPTGGRAAMAFRSDWESGSALYLPCDRKAGPGHTNWRSWRWDSSKDITHYLRLVHEILNEEDYTVV
jgi:hypothetical protein